MAISLRNITIDRIKWGTFEISSRQRGSYSLVPCRPGVYCIYNKGELLYIGCSMSLPLRMHNGHKIIKHLRNGKKVVSTDVYMTYHVTKRYREIEMVLINQCKPVFNICIPTLKNKNYISSKNHHPYIDWVFKCKI